MIISPNLKCYNTLEYVRQSKANILCQRVEYFIQAILKSADIRAIVNMNIEYEYEYEYWIFYSGNSQKCRYKSYREGGGGRLFCDNKGIWLNDFFEKCTMIMI